MSKPRITLALGGGGARGLAHLGVIEVLQEAGFEIERIVGISIGSLAGAITAFDPDIEAVQARVLSYLISEEFQRHQETLMGSKGSQDQGSGGLFSWYERIKTFLRANRIFRRVVTRPSMLPGIVLQEITDALLPDDDISASKIPLSIVTVDLLSGHQIVMERGPVRLAVRASSSIPGIFPPVDYEGMQLADVGVLCTLPTIVARSYQPSTLVAVDVGIPMRRVERCATAIDVLMRMDEIGEVMFRKHVREHADLVIHPKVAGIDWFDFTSAEKLVQAGRQATRSAITEIKQLASE